MLSCVHSNLDHVDYLCVNLRDEDEEELKAMNIDGRYALAFPFTQNHSLTFTILDDETPLAMFGTIPARNNEASIWRLCRNEFQNNYREICRHARDFIELLQSSYSTIYNVVPANNKRTIRFLRFCGFQFGEKININDVDFIKFFRCNSFYNNVNNKESRPVMH